MVPKPVEVTPSGLHRSRGLRRGLLLTLLLSGLAAACQSTPPPAQRNLDLGTRRKLLFNDSLVSDPKGGFQITPDPAQRTEGPVLSPEKPWERYGLHSVSVVDHNGLYKLWYGARGEDKVGRLCYATSSDGIHWTRPDLGLVEYEGSKENNIVLENVGSVFLDPSASDEKRFKII